MKDASEDAAVPNKGAPKAARRQPRSRRRHDDTTLHRSTFVPEEDSDGPGRRRKRCEGGRRAPSRQRWVEGLGHGLKGRQRGKGTRRMNAEGDSGRSTGSPAARAASDPSMIPLATLGHPAGNTGGDVRGEGKVDAWGTREETRRVAERTARACQDDAPLTLREGQVTAVEAWPRKGAKGDSLDDATGGPLAAATAVSKETARQRRRGAAATSLRAQGGHERHFKDWDPETEKEIAGG
jgi:hypothetical protein